MSAAVIAAIDRLTEVAASRSKTKAVTPLENRLAKQLRQAFKKQERAFLKRFATLRDEFDATESRRLREAAEPDWLGLFDAATLATIQAFEIPLSQFIQLALSAGARYSLAQFSIEDAFDLKNPRAVAYLKDYAADLITGINDVTKAEIRTIITQAVEQGTSYSKVAAQLKAKYQMFYEPKPQLHIKDRSHLIAITEIGQGYEAGNAIVVQDLQDAGLVMEKSWQTVGDSRVSDECQENQEAGWIPFDDPFPSGDDRPLRFPGCRCTALYRRKGAGE